MEPCKLGLSQDAPFAGDWRLAVDYKYAGKIGHTIEESLRQKIGVIDKLLQSYETLQTVLLCGRHN